MALWKKNISGQGDPPGPLGKYITMYNKAVKTLGTDNPEVLKRFFASQQYGQNNTQVQQNNNINKAPQPKESKIGNIAGDVGTLALSTLQNFGMNIPGDVIKTVAPKAAILDVLPQTTTNQYVKQRNQSLVQNMIDVGNATNMVAAFEVGSPLIGKGIQAGVKVATPLIKSGIKEAEKVVSNTYKINPWRFKPDPNKFYRGIGEDGLKDALESRVFRSPTMRPTYKGIYKTPETYWADANNFKVAERMSTRTNNSIMNGKKVIAEYPKTGEINIKYRGPNNEVIDNYATQGELPINQGRILKQNWLKGYKEIKVPNTIDNKVLASIDDNIIKNSYFKDIDFKKYYSDIIKKESDIYKSKVLDFPKYNPSNDKFIQNFDVNTLLNVTHPSEIKTVDWFTIADVKKPLDIFKLPDREFSKLSIFNEKNLWKQLWDKYGAERTYREFSNKAMNLGSSLSKLSEAPNVVPNELELELFKNSKNKVSSWIDSDEWVRRRSNAANETFMHAKMAQGATKYQLNKVETPNIKELPPFTHSAVGSAQMDDILDIPKINILRTFPRVMNSAMEHELIHASNIKNREYFLKGITSPEFIKSENALHEGYLNYLKNQHESQVRGVKALLHLKENGVWSKGDLTDEAIDYLKTTKGLDNDVQNLVNNVSKYELKKFLNTVYSITGGSIITGTGFYKSKKP